MSVAEALIAGLFSASLIGVLAMGFSMWFEATGAFHFEYLGMFLVAGYTVYALQNAGVNLWIGGAAAVVVVSVLTAVLDAAVFRTMRNHNSTLLASLIGSLGLLICIQGTLAIIFGNFGLSIPRPGALAGSFNVVVTDVSRVKVVQTVYMVCLLGVLHMLSARTQLGREIRAVAKDRNRAMLLGISVSRVMLFVMLITTVMLVPTATLGAMNQGLTPYGFLTTFLLATVVVFAAGLGSTGGAVLLACVSEAIATVVTLWVPRNWSETIMFAVLVAVILIRPHGLFTRTSTMRSV